MELSQIIQRYLLSFKARHAQTTNEAQWSAINALLGCRTAQYGKLQLACEHCQRLSSCHRSCGHRSCNQCQNHCTTEWLQRQKAKLLPVDYFMVTFTLPGELRAWAQVHQKRLYSLLFECAISTLKDFGLNDKAFASELAMTAVLHTHTRRLDYHPHLHVIVPGGGINQQRNQWKKLKGKYLFNGFKLATVFRARMLKAIKQAGFKVPTTPKSWVVQCTRVGRGLPALEYLSRYLYRGVISNRNILSDDGTFVTFQYTESRTGTVKTRRVRGEDFIKLVIQHALPRGFRRVRDFGFLHGNAKRLLKIVQWVLQVELPNASKIPRPKFICQHCHGVMSVVGFKRPSCPPG